jgi:hypothetical protein
MRCQYGASRVALEFLYRKTISWESDSSIARAEAVARFEEDQNKTIIAAPIGLTGSAIRTSPSVERTSVSSAENDRC